MPVSRLWRSSEEDGRGTLQPLTPEPGDQCVCRQHVERQARAIDGLAGLLDRPVIARAVNDTEPVETAHIRVESQVLGRRRLRLVL